MSLGTRILHFAVRSFQVARRSIWFFSRPRAVGVHGVPLTPQGKLVLVRLSYAKGWRLPGGGKKQNETSRNAVLRELREEIGLTAYAGLELVSELRHRTDFRRGEASLFVVRGVQYQPRWSLEVKEVGEFAIDALPTDTAVITRKLLALASHQLSA